MIWADKIPGWLRGRTAPATISEIAEHFGRTRRNTIQHVKRLVEAGELIDLGGNQISAPPNKWDREPESAPPKQQRIWTVAVYSDRHGGSWTAASIARLAEANPEYVREYLAWLARQGHVRITTRPGLPNLYRIHPDAPPAAKAPVWVNRRNRELRKKQRRKA